MAEHADAAWRGKALAAVFLAQGVGRVVATLVAYMLVASSMSASSVWRVMLLLGALPYVPLLRWRWRLPGS